MPGAKSSPTPDDIMSPADLKPLLVRSKHEPVSCVIGLAKSKDGVILLDRRLKPKKLLAELKKQAVKAKLDLEIQTLRFGKAVVDTDADASLVKFVVNKEAPNALQLKLLERVRKVGFGKVDIEVDDKLESEPEDDAPPTTAFTQPVSNPFEAPDAQLEIQTYALEEVRTFAVAQAVNARNDFEAAIRKVEKVKGEAAAEEEAKKQLMVSIALTIALMPTGPIVEAASNAIAGPKLQDAIIRAIGNKAGDLQNKFGPRGMEVAAKAMDVATSKAITSLAAKFEPTKAKQALEFGVSSLQGQVVKFAAQGNKKKCIENYLEAVLKSANDSMHNLTDLIGGTRSYSEALGYYNYFSKPLQGIYEATLGQQVDDMLSEVSDVLAQNVEGAPPAPIGKEHRIVRLTAYGRPRFAHIAVTRNVKTFIPSYEFVKWVTPDMEPMAVKMATEELEPSQISGHIPDPLREPGERIVLVDGWGRERVMLVDVEDQGIFWKEYGVSTFKKWAENGEEEKAFRARGAMQIGGLDKADLGNIKDVKAPPD